MLPPARILLILLAAFAAPVAPAAPPVLKAGAAAVDITPTRFPVHMPGGFGPNPAERAHDPLHARALVLSDGTTTVALVVVDNLGVAREAADEAKRMAAQKCDIPPERILVSATHTHTAPPSNTTDGPAEAVAYRKVLVEGIAEAVVRAHARLAPAELGAASHPVPDEVFNRRWFLRPGKMTENPFGGTDLVKMNPPNTADTLLSPAGTTDPDVAAVWVRDAATKAPLAVYANYALHYVGGIPKGEASADYFGEFARLMPNRVGAKPDRFVAMLSNGASGNINNIPFGADPPRPPREPFEQVQIVAAKVADAAWHARTKVTAYRSDLRVGMIQREVTLRVRKPTPDQVARAEAVLATKDAAEVAKLPRLAEPYAQRTLALAKAGDMLTVPLQAVAVGDLAFVGIPFETFVETGLDLKKRSPFPRTIVVGIANGYNGYLPTPEQHRLGGYETWLGTNKVQEDTSVILTDHLLAMLQELRGVSGR